MDFVYSFSLITLKFALLIDRLTMEIQAKYVLPKVQMIINGMLSQSQSSQIDFSHQEYSIQIKNRNHLTLNWYEPELTDLQWSLEFIGVKSLKNISVSDHQAKRIRVLFWRANALHFFEGQAKDRQRAVSMRKSLIQSQKVIQVPLSNNDDVLYISEDLFPKDKKAVFFIETIHKQFYVLIATDKKQELINLNQQSKISKIYSSVVGLWGSMIDQNQAQKMVVSNILVNELDDSETFKSITLRDFELEIRFVNIPINPGDKCKFESYQLHSVNLRNLIQHQLNLPLNDILIRSQIYKINQAEVMAIFLLKDLTQSDHYFMVSVLIDYQKKQQKEVRKLTIFEKNMLSVDFEKVDDIDELKHLIIKKQFKTQTVIGKLDLKDLKVLEQNKQSFEGDSLLCSSQNKSHLLLLSPYKVFQISPKLKQMSPENAQSAMEEENFDETINSVKQIAKFISMNKHNIQNSFKQGKYTPVFAYLSTIGTQLNEKLTSRRSSIKTQAQLIQIMKIWTAFSLYQSIIRSQSQTQKKQSHQNRTFNDLNIKNNSQPNYKEITAILNNLLKNKKVDTFLTIWIDFVDCYKSRQFFKDQSVRKVESQILHQEFSHLINLALQNDLKQRKGHDQIIEFIKGASGIIKIERQIYRELLGEENNFAYHDNLKSIALEKVNFDLIQVIFFETDQISKQQIRECFKIIKKESIEHYEGFAREFVSEYLHRMKQEKIANPEVRNFSNLLLIFPEQIGLMRKIFEEGETDLGILFSLREGRRKEVAQKIFSVAQRMKYERNNEKLLLAVQNLKEIEMKQ